MSFSFLDYLSAYYIIVMSKRKTIVDGPLGFKTTEETARHLEALLKTLPKGNEYKYRKKNTSVEMSFEPGERASIDVITTDSVDREKEVVLPDGIDLTSYRRNAVVLYSHNPEKPIGKSLWIKNSLNGIKSKTLYANRPDDYKGDFLPDLVFALVQQQILKGRSIGFIPVVIDSPTAEQIKARPDWRNANAIISKSELFEYSIVAIPCNEDALQLAVSKGLKEFSAKSLEALGLPTVKRFNTAAEAIADCKAYKAHQIAKPKIKAIDENRLLLKMIEQIQIDPDAIARQVLEQLKDRGKV